jgi:hypothetical protein
MRGRLKVADHATASPGAVDEVRDHQLFEQHLRDAASAEEDPVQDDEGGVKGFIFGAEPDLAATVRWHTGPTDDAKAALESWASDRGLELAFDGSFAAADDD